MTVYGLPDVILSASFDLNGFSSAMKLSKTCFPKVSTA